MVPLYIMLVPSDRTLLSVINKVLKSIVTRSVVVGTVVVLGYNASSILFGESDLFEYPNYGLWGTALVWNCLWWSAIVLACLTTKTDAHVLARPPILSRIIIFLLFVFALTPYVGLRNYPALAMFSNLRTEGQNPNHWVPSYDVFGYEKDWVTVIDTNFQPVRDLQINLGKWFPEKLATALSDLGLSDEFYICPPTWPPDHPQEFVPFSIPYIELRRRVSSNAWPTDEDNHAVFVSFERNAPNRPVQKYRVDSTITASQVELRRPLSWFEKYFVRFRSFSNDYSPCRH